MRSQVYFYYPPGLDDNVVPESVGVFVPGRPGNYVWTVKTYGILSKLGFPCCLTDRLPNEGIIVTHREFFTNDIIPNRRQLFVCIVADFWYHPFAHLHIVQNPLFRSSHAWPTTFIPHWPESGLIRRDPARACLFENVSYFGLPARLAPQLRSARFFTQMHEHGFNFRIVNRDRWNDYSDTDAVLAVRSFAAVPFNKFPATKLYNSWIAGVPALLGHESAYQAERRSEYDYFEVRSVDDVLRTLIRLRDNQSLRAAVESNCADRAADLIPHIAEAWISFLTGVAIPAYRLWRRQTAANREVFRVTRRLRYTAFVCLDFFMRAYRLVRKCVRAIVY